MFVLKGLFVLLHVITAAGWFGLALRLGGQGRAALAADGPAGEALADEGQRTVRLMTIFSVLTLVFALGAYLFSLGSLGAYRPLYDASFLLIVILVAVQFFVIRTGWQRLQAALEGEGDAEGARKRVAIGTGIGHLIWLVVVVLMLWPNYLAPAF